MERLRFIDAAIFNFLNLPVSNQIPESLLPIFSWKVFFVPKTEAPVPLPDRLVQEFFEIADSVILDILPAGAVPHRVQLLKCVNLG